MRMVQHNGDMPDRDCCWIRDMHGIGVDVHGRHVSCAGVLGLAELHVVHV